MRKTRSGEYRKIETGKHCGLHWWRGGS